MTKHSQSSQNSKFAMSLQYLKKKVGDEVEFLHADKNESLQQVDFNTLGIKVSYKVILSLLMSMFKHSQSTQSDKFAISLQYLKKEVRDEVHFLHAYKHQSLYKLALSFLIKMARHVQRPKIGNWQYFCNILRKNNFFHADKHETFLQVDANIFSGFGQT